jgi:hypothetical protein
MVSACCRGARAASRTELQAIQRRDFEIAAFDGVVNRLQLLRDLFLACEFRHLLAFL